MDFWITNRLGVDGEAFTPFDMEAKNNGKIKLIMLKDEILVLNWERKVTILKNIRNAEYGLFR